MHRQPAVSVCRALLVLALILLPVRGARADEPSVTAFVDVHVLPMDSARVLDHQTVLVEGGRIAAMGPAASVAIPAGARRIAGAGRWLLPGLADMHVHVNEEDDLALFLANGVTTVLDMGLAPSPMVAEDRRRIASGDLAGPQLFFGFILDGNHDLGLPAAPTPEAARDAVRFAKANGYDFIKVYNSLSVPAFDAIVQEAGRQHMAVIGHGVRAVGLPQALGRGQVMVAHAEEFYYTAFANKPDDDAIPGVVAATRASGAFVTPNLSGFAAITEQWGRPDVLDGYLHAPEVASLSPRKRIDWSNSGYQTRKPANLARTYGFLARFTRALSDAGVPLLTGTDAPFLPGQLPGYSEHRELHELVAAGLTPFAALTAATRAPGAFIARTVPGAAPFGTVAPGMRADLLLVSDNPLRNLDVLKTPSGVMAGGRWYDAAALAGLLETRKRHYQDVLGR